ncbi:zinc ABC transporter substrate-binding protein [Acidihalobacter prosperus]|uniref:High-affinity zinc uptake system protein ZnuA n=1 Tax=Acidihalobacter prosperus TaxID=160660 RepID=A0A1A6C1S6_9GAMM|nr:zinc ABC transporter substrate-binding protein [Acidihalobacter prosperus]OBS08517.1 Zinc ABC transporter, periplasmic-binding protein ZnuA [Acidihalobacter prosperus]
MFSHASARPTRRALFAISLVIWLLSPTSQAATHVVASIKPIDSLVAGVMAGTGERPHLLVPGAASPHTYSLRPSDMAALSSAQVVFWVGPMLETFLARPLAQLPSGVRVVALARAPGVRLLPVRVGFGVAQEEHDDAHESPDTHAGDAGINPHIWLDPRNAEAMVREIARTLSAVDPAHAARYRANADALEARLRRLDDALQRTLAPVRGVPFMVFHDAYAYFDARYRLNAVGALTVEPSLPPGARRVEAAREAIRHYGVRCVFREPEFASPLIRTVTAGRDVRVGVLDPLGADLKPGPDLYFRLMRNLGAHLEACLAH